MRQFIILWISLVSFGMSAQNSGKENKETSAYTIHSANLCLGDALFFGNKSIRFKEIVSDSRCPKEVTCIWAGEVEVLVEVFEDGVSKGEMVINRGSTLLADLFGMANLKISGMQVEPYPTVERKIKPEEYNVNLSISEKTEND